MQVSNVKKVDVEINRSGIFHRNPSKSTKKSQAEAKKEALKKSINNETQKVNNSRKLKESKGQGQGQMINSNA